MTLSMSMSKGQQYSLMLHLALLVIMIFGLPNFLHRKLDDVPVAISVDILPIAPVSNVKPQDKYEPPHEKKPVSEQKTEKKATPEAHKVVEAPQEKPEKVSAKDIARPEEKVPLVKPKEAVKQKEKKADKKSEKKEDDLDSILKSVSDMEKAEKSQHPTEKAVTETNKNKAVSQTYDNSQPLTMSETDAIRQQIQQCWNPPTGTKDAANLASTLHIELSQDGTVNSVELSGDRNRYNSDSFFRAVADSAMRAVKKCSPLKNLPPEKYAGLRGWHELDMTFDPKDM